ncbi:MAG: hypothetical protein WCI18_11840 [Pseudomonadota bacterium]
MLKFIFIKNRRIPVPIPIFNVKEALFWVTETFAVDDRMITRVILNGEELPFETVETMDWSLDALSELVVQVESPREISAQSIEVVRDFCLVLLSRIKPAAVALYQFEGSEILPSFSEIFEDMEYLHSLRIHINGILDQFHSDIAPFEAMSLVCDRVMGDLIREKNQNNWKKCSEILLHRLDPFLKKLHFEVVELQKRFSSETDSDLVLPLYGKT